MVGGDADIEAMLNLNNTEQAAGKRKSHAQIGAIKDKYEKGKKESVELGEAFGGHPYLAKQIDSKIWRKLKRFYHLKAGE